MSCDGVEYEAVRARYRLVVNLGNIYIVQTGDRVLKGLLHYTKLECGPKAREPEQLARTRDTPRAYNQSSERTAQSVPDPNYPVAGVLATGQARRMSGWSSLLETKEAHL